MLEFSDSLNAYGRDLDLETYKVVDQMTGKMMGVSSDLTTQAFRIDTQMEELPALINYVMPALY